MKLIEALAAGIRGAEIGSVVLLRRGTSTNATYYSDFEFQQQFSTSPIALDSNGSAVLYVNELVDVVVRDANGVIVREFVAGDNATSVEVISQSFTGVDYEDGSSGANKPTTLAAVLDAWKTSAGAIDFKVLFNGVATNLQSAFSSTFFNVRNYGAIGNGVADDRTAIIAAQAAATAAGGGIVFFPPGIYRVTNSISLAANVQWLGCGGLSTKIAGDNSVAGVITLPGNGSGSVSSLIGLWLGCINNVSGTLISYSAVTSGEYHFTDCVLGNDALSSNSLYAGAGGTAALKAVFTRCYAKLSAGTSQLLINSGAARLIVRDCDLINTNNTGVTLVECPDNGFFEGNRFDWSAATVGPGIKYLLIGPTIGTVVVIGNQFVANAAMACTAIYNSLAAPYLDCLEYGNFFGDMGSGVPNCTPYGYTTDGYAVVGGARQYNGHQTRTARTETIGGVVAAAVTLDPKAFGTSIVARTGGANLTVNANKGSFGDKWLLEVYNTSGGAITLTSGTNIIFDPAIAPLPVTNNGFAQVQLAWMITFAGVGVWYQVGKAVLL